MNPIKPSLKTEIVPLIIIALTIVLSFYFYSVWPDIIASHWNFKGEVDGYTNKAFIVWIFPLMIASIYAMFLALPYIDPKKKNYEGFSKLYHIFKAVMLLILLILFIGVGLFNLGYGINIAFLATSSIGAVMIFIGLFLKNVKPNWFLGIKNPWTLSSNNVWKKTHMVGGYFFVIFGVIIVACNFLPPVMGMILFIIGILLVIIGTTVYSYIIYYNESKRK